MKIYMKEKFLWNISLKKVKNKINFHDLILVETSVTLTSLEEI